MIDIKKIQIGNVQIEFETWSSNDEYSKVMVLNNQLCLIKTDKKEEFINDLNIFFKKYKYN